MASNPEPTSLTHLPLDPADRPRYSAAQMQQYFDRIKLPQKHRDSVVLKDPSQARTKQHGLPLLRALALYHGCNVTFDNLVLHYSASKTVALDPAELFVRIVERRRGGRCMEQNTFLGTALRSLGYEVRNCAGRVARSMSPYGEVRKSQPTTYDGWNHMLNLVRLDDKWWVVDVGMGAMGPNVPFPVRDGFETTSVAPRIIRLQHRPIAETHTPADSTVGPPKLWCYDVCYEPPADGSGIEKTWTPVYCFTETEFLPQDYELMSWFTSTNPSSFFTRFVTCTKMVMGDDGDEATGIVGNVTLFKDAVRETIGAKRNVIMDCKTEEERVRVLAEVFGVHLTQDEKDGIPDDKRLA